MSTSLPPETKIVVVGRERWSTYSVFNRNAFPADVAGLVESCSTRAAVLLVNFENVRLEIERDNVRFADSLQAQSNDLTQAVTSRPDLRPVAYYDGLGYITALYGCFIGVKSFLDIYAQLMTALILSNASMTFKRAKFGDNKLAGGAFIKWLKGSAPKTFTKAGPLADLTYRHSKDWITPTVLLRDTIAHYADIPGMKHMRLELKNSSPVFDVREIEEPAMPDGASVISFCNILMEKLRAYVSESVVLLPKINLEMINANSFLVSKGSGL